MELAGRCKFDQAAYVVAKCLLQSKLVSAFQFLPNSVLDS